VEEDRVARVQRQHDGYDERGPPSECARSQKPRHDRGPVKPRHPDFCEGAAESIEQRTHDERGNGRATEHVPEIDRVGLKELDVRAQIGTEVPSADEGHRQRLEPPQRDGNEK
jgi:hypothetical protein